MRWFKKAAPVVDSPFSGADHALRISALLSPAVIKLNMEAQDREEAFEELVDLLVVNGSAPEREAALEALRRREELGSTGIGNGVAIPHAKHASIPRLTGALGVSTRGIDFDSVDKRPAHVVFVLLAEATNPGPHIQALACVAHLAQSATFRKRAMEAKTAAEMVEIIRTEE